MGALIEDVQGLGIIAEKDVPLNDGFKSPVTKLPMNIAESNTSLRGAYNVFKSKICNSTLNKADTNVYVCPKSVVDI